MKEGFLKYEKSKKTNKKWAKVGIRIVEINGIAEYYLIKDGTKISPKKAIEIYNNKRGVVTDE